jgi:hypothetical protein
MYLKLLIYVSMRVSYHILLPRFLPPTPQGGISSLTAIEAICSPTLKGFHSIIEDKALSLPSSCHIGTCKRIFRETIVGLAGAFSSEEVQRLRACLPDAVLHEEPDGKVMKAEDMSLFHVDTDTIGGDESTKKRFNGEGGGGGRRRMRSRRLSEAPSSFPVEALNRFTVDQQEDSSASDSISLNAWQVAQGIALEAPVEKRQQLNQQKQWNLDRIDQRNLPLDGAYVYGTEGTPGIGEGVTVYCVDTGILPDHVEFQRVKVDGKSGEVKVVGPSRARYGWNFVEDMQEAFDADGHGTHVAATAAGLRAGVAKGAEVVAVKILDGMGYGTISDTVAALDWVAVNAVKPAVVVLSLGVQARISDFCKHQLYPAEICFFCSSLI